MAAKRSLALLVATVTVAAVAAPALAVTPVCTTLPSATTCIAGVPVTLTGLAGTRQFAVETVTGTALTGLDLGTGGNQPFRTHVTDTDFSSLNEDYSVFATMSNLYLNTGAGHSFAVKIPSSGASLAYGTNPLSALGLSLTDLPKLSLTGTLGSCASLPEAVQTTLGLSALGAVLDLTDHALVQLCTALGAGVPVTTTIDGVLRTVTPTVSSVLDLPTALTGATPGAFSNPAYAGTVGATDPAAGGAPPATPLTIMTGTHGLSSGLRSALTTALDNVLAGLPLTTANDAGARTTIAEATTKLRGSATVAVAAVGNALGFLSAAKQVAVLNTLTSELLPPVLADLTKVNSEYFAYPILHAAPSTPVPGTYDGTLTVTFVQS